MGAGTDAQSGQESGKIYGEYSFVQWILLAYMVQCHVKVVHISGLLSSFLQCMQEVLLQHHDVI